MKPQCLRLHSEFVNYMVIILCCILFLSCERGSENLDNTDGKGHTGTSYDNELSPAIKRFVGNWSRQSGYNFPQSWIFFADGTCASINPDNKGSWTYDEQTKRLATTAGSYVYIVNISTDTEWSGTSPSTNKTTSFAKESESSSTTMFGFNIFYHYEWINADGVKMRFKKETNDFSPTTTYGRYYPDVDKNECEITKYNYSFVESGVCKIMIDIYNIKTFRKDFEKSFYLYIKDMNKKKPSLVTSKGVVFTANKVIE